MAATIEQNNAGFQILALDGGGIKGLYSAIVLAALEEDLGISITDHFDLIVGTSTGGIIALGLGLGLKPRELVEFYIQDGPSIFPNAKWWQKIRRRTQQWIIRKYPQEALKFALQKAFGNKLLGDSQKRLVIPSFNLDADDVYLFKTPHHPRLKRDWKVEAWKVALATSAAPTFFPSFNGVDSTRLIDGGVWANNPTIVGIAEAISMLDVKLQSIRVFNLATPSEVKKRHQFLNQGGLLLWAKQAPDIIMKGQSRSAVATAKHLIGTDNFECLETLLPSNLLSMDKLDTQTLISAASSTSRNFSSKFEAKFANHKASPYQPIYPTNGGQDANA